MENDGLEQHLNNFVLSAKSKTSNNPMVRVEVKSVSSGSLLNVVTNSKKKQKTKGKRKINSSVKL